MKFSSTIQEKSFNCDRQILAAFIWFFCLLHPELFFLMLLLKNDRKGFSRWNSPTRSLSTDDEGVGHNCNCFRPFSKMCFRFRANCPLHFRMPEWLPQQHPFFTFWICIWWLPIILCFIFHSWLIQLIWFEFVAFSLKYFIASHRQKIRNDSNQERNLTIHEIVCLYPWILVVWIGKVKIIRFTKVEV